jgi:hypothetical protein
MNWQYGCFLLLSAGKLKLQASSTMSINNKNTATETMTNDYLVVHIRGEEVIKNHSETGEAPSETLLLQNCKLWNPIHAMHSLEIETVALFIRIVSWVMMIRFQDPWQRARWALECMIDWYLLASLRLGSDNFVNLVSTWQYLLVSLRLGWDNCNNLVTIWRAVTKNSVNLKPLDSMRLARMMQVHVLTERRISKSLIGALRA